MTIFSQSNYNFYLSHSHSLGIYPTTSRNRREGCCRCMASHTPAPPHLRLMPALPHQSYLLLFTRFHDDPFIRLDSCFILTDMPNVCSFFCYDRKRDMSKSLSLNMSSVCSPDSVTAANISCIWRKCIMSILSPFQMVSVLWTLTMQLQIIIIGYGQEVLGVSRDRAGPNLWQTRKLVL